jgi:hypothetical protein
MSTLAHVPPVQAKEPETETDRPSRRAGDTPAPTLHRAGNQNVQRLAARDASRPLLGVRPAPGTPNARVAAPERKPPAPAPRVRAPATRPTDPVRRAAVVEPATPAATAPAPGQVSPAPAVAADRGVLEPPQTAPSVVAETAAPVVPETAIAPAPGAGARAPAVPAADGQRRGGRHAQAIQADYASKERQATSIASNRRQQTTAVLGQVRASISGLLTSAIAMFQSIVLGQAAQLAGAATAAIATVQSVISGLVASLTARAIQVTALVDALATNAVAAVQARVAAIGAQIAGLISSVSLPDIPGIVQIRARAVAMLGQGTALVNQALASALTVVRAVTAAGVQVVTSLLQMSLAAATSALQGVGGAIRSMIASAGAVLRNAVTLVSTALRAVLAVAVVPVLRRVEVFIHARIDDARRLVVMQLQHNRDQHLEVLSTSGTGGGAGAGQSASPDDDLVVADAVRVSTLIVTSFETVSGRGLAATLSVIRGIGGRIFAGVVARLVAILARIRAVVTRILDGLVRLVAALVQVVGIIIRTVGEALQNVVDSVRGMVQRPIDAVIDFAVGAVTRIREFIGSFVRNLIAGLADIGSGLRGILGAFPPPTFSRGPIIIKPPPGPIVLPGLQTILLFFFVVGAIVLFVAPTLMGTVTAILLALGITVAPWVVVVIIGVVAVALVLLVLFLLIVLIRFLRRRGRGKRVIRATPSKVELGVGGPDIRASATLTLGIPLFPPLTWTVNPGSAPPVGVSVIGSGRTVRVRAAHPPHGTVTGGASFTVRAALSANPADFADTAAILLVQVLEAHYNAVPALVPVPSLIPGTPPANSAEPNRNGIAGNTAQVLTTTAPAGRAIRLRFRRSLGASLAGTTVRPGSPTGDIGLRIAEARTGALLDETMPSTSGPAALMADLTVNAVPTRVSALTFVGPTAGRYGVRNRIGFTPSDALHPPLTRIVGELITHNRDDFNVPPPNGAFNPGFLLRLAVPANRWVDQLFTPSGIRNVADGRPAIDVNRFVGPGVPQLPRTLIYRQRFVYSSWQGAGTVISNVLADGQHIRSLIGAPGAFGFSTHHRFGGVASTPPAEPYLGPPLIVLTAIVATPTALGATALAADGVATATVTASTTVAGRTVTWTVLSGGVTFTAGNPSIPPAPATLRAGLAAGTARIRAADTIYGNRRADGNVTIAPVALRNMRAAQATVPPGTTTTTVSVDALPGGRVVDWTVDATAAAAGVTVTPPRTGPAAPGVTVTVTRPAAFTGRVTVTATDSVLTRRSSKVRIRFN